MRGDRAIEEGSIGAMRLIDGLGICDEQSVYVLCDVICVAHLMYIYIHFNQRVISGTTFVIEFPHIYDGVLYRGTLLGALRCR